MESVFKNNIFWVGFFLLKYSKMKNTRLIKAQKVKNETKVRFGFSLSKEKVRELEQNHLDLSMVVFLGMPGHHGKIKVIPSFL